MGRPTTKESVRLKAKIKSLVEQGLSLSEIGRTTGKSSQAVHQYLIKHNLMTVEMERRADNNLDKDTALDDKEGGNEGASQ